MHEHPYIAVINLPHRTDRLEHFKKQAQEQGFTFNVHEGVYGEPTHVAINKAWKNVIRFAKEQGLPEIIAMEDDCIFTRPGAFMEWLDHKPNDFDIYLGGVYGRDIGKKGTIKTFCGLHCILVNSRFYDTFLKVSDRENIDIALGGKGRYILYDVAKQIDGYSDNMKRYVNYNG
jgi:hypothetical protein